MKTTNKAQKDVNRFYKWMKKMRNIYLSDNEQMSMAFEKVYNSNL